MRILFALLLCCLGFSAYAASTITLSVGGLSVGNYAANGLGVSGLTSPADQVFIGTTWGATTKYLRAQTGTPVIVQTSASSRDQEVTTWLRDGTVYLRMDGSGNALFFRINGDVDQYYFGVGFGFSNVNFIGGSTGGTFASYVALGGGSLSSIPGYDANNTAGQTFTFGVSGVTVYAKFNGNQFWSSTDFRHATSGYMAIQANTGDGFRDTTFTFLDQSATYSDLANKAFDVRDFGVKTLTATGSMTAGSSTLTLTSNPGFAIGDNVIVEIGGESGAGARGTLGVGGAWPNTHYANYATLSATTPANGTYAYTDDTLTVYYYYNGWAAALTSMATQYYQNTVAPKSLRAKITNVAGNVLTLNASSATATTNAMVYFDNFPPADALYGQTAQSGGLLPASWSVRYPAGTYAFGQQQFVSASNFTLFGAGSDYSYFASYVDGLIATPPTASILTAHNAMMASSGTNGANTYFKSPKGVEPAGVHVYQVSNTALRDFGVISNFRFQGYGLGWTYGGQVLGVNFDSVTNGSATRVSLVDNSQSAFSTQYSTNVSCFQCAAAYNDGHQQYTQWAFDWTNSTGGYVYAPVVTSPYLIAGFECFVSYSCSYIGAKSVNGMFAINSSGGWLIDFPQIIVSPMSQYSENSWYHGNGAFDINTNIWNTSQQQANFALGGVIKNPYLYSLYPVNANNDIQQGVNVNGSVSNVQIIGDYYALNGGTNKGKFNMGNYTSPSANRGAQGIRNDSMQNIYVEGVRVIGTTDSTYNGNIANVGPLSQIRNCIADRTSGTAINCVTNSIWISGGGN